MKAISPSYRKKDPKVFFSIQEKGERLTTPIEYQLFTFEICVLRVKRCENPINQMITHKKKKGGETFFLFN